MNCQFSPAAERVLLYAAGCASRTDYAELAGPALLLGLLAESECRAALMLAKHGITTQAVYQHRPKLLTPPPDSGSNTIPQDFFTPELNRSFQIISQSAAEYMNPPMLETEHLLLSLLAADDELSDWLKQRGMRLEDVDAGIRKRHGYQEGPLPLESEQSKINSGQWAVGSEQGSGFRVQNSSFIPHPSSPISHPSSFIPHPSSLAPLRIIDAAANRAREGLRVAEDFVRFVLDDRHLTEQCKKLRHDLAALLDQIPSEQLLAARETQADVGTTLATPGEEHRGDLGGVLSANFGRLEESLRSLEEFGKLVDPAWSAEIKQLRYRSYTLQRAVEITRSSIKRLSQARLYVLVDGRSSMEEFRQLAQTLIAAGVHVIQLRDKKLDDCGVLERGRLLRELTRGGNTLFIMNDRPDLAALCHADGVHLGQEDVLVKDARTIIGPGALIGVSTHTIEQARQAVLDGANYIGVGPTFSSDTKQFDQFPGLEFLRAVAAEISLPAFAIGGITLQNLSQILTTGVTRIAVSDSIITAPDPEAAVKKFLAVM